MFFIFGSRIPRWKNYVLGWIGIALIVAGIIFADYGFLAFAAFFCMGFLFLFIDSILVLLHDLGFLKSEKFI